MAFTEEQLAAINSEGSNIIVSAGAGSGKTAVLTERVIRKLKSGISVDRLLVLTFTNEAASEMKSRIRASITENKLYEQLDLLEQAYITTFDSYALSLVKKYHYLLNIDKHVGIIQDGIIPIKKKQFLDEIFLEEYGHESFIPFIDEYSIKDDTRIKEFILQVSNSIDLITNKDDYIANYMDNYFSSEYIDLLIDDYLHLIKNEITDLRNVYDKFASFSTDSLLNKLDSWFKPLFEGTNYNDFKLFTTIPAVRFVGVSEDGISLKEEIKEKIDCINQLLRFADLDDIKDKILINKDKVEVILDIVKKLNTLIDTYKAKIGMYEFNDIANMATCIVRDNLEVREEIKNYFNEIMIDEYQDTSDIQEEFIGYIANNNVYMVGDIKQSIYRFRNANPYIFQDKYNNYSKNNGGIKIDLLKNFRSRKEVLDNINEIFNLIMDDEIGNANYLEAHNMVYQNKLYDLEDTLHNNKMEVYTYQMDDDDKYSKEEKEIFIIAKDIEEKVKNGYLVFDKKSSKLRKIKYSDICIITDRNKYLELYKKILEYKGIPTNLYMDRELNYDMVIMVIKNLVELVYYVKNNDFGDRFRYTFMSIARSFIFSYDDEYIYKAIKEKTYYNNMIVTIAKEINILEPLPVIINDIIDKYDIYYKLTTVSDIEANMVRISNLIDIASGLNDMGYSLLEFVNYMDYMNEFNLSVKYSSKTGSADSVKIMNIHKSKGLEFSLCYYTGLHNKFMIKEVTNKFIFSKKYGIILTYLSDDTLCNNILKDLYTYQYYLEEVSEKIRLFYVALTRCREKMIVLANSQFDGEGYDRLVPNSVRLKYHSFLDILNSIDLVINKYAILKDGEYTKDYQKTKIKDMVLATSNRVIENREIKGNYKKNIANHFSKEVHEIIDNTDKFKEGSNIHKVFEYDSFSKPKSKYVANFLKQIPNNFINIYREYEFKYNLNNMDYHGIIDLMVEYDKVIYIIDYKSKNIDNLEYITQLNGYKEYISKITNKEIKTYLYSIYDNVLMEV